MGGRQQKLFASLPGAAFLSRLSRGGRFAGPWLPSLRPSGTDTGKLLRDAPTPQETAAGAPGRALERRLLLANLAPLLLGALAVAVTSREDLARTFPRALGFLAAIYAGGLLLHLLLRLLRFRSDQLLVPTLCLLFLAAGVYHPGPPRPGGPGTTIEECLSDVLA